MADVENLAAIWVFWAGVGGAIAGSTVTFVGQLIVDKCRHVRETEAQRTLDAARKSLLKTALENPPKGNEWRSLETLSRIVGADYETTTRLLIELGARGSEKAKDVWALESEQPLRRANANQSNG